MDILAALRDAIDEAANSGAVDVTIDMPLEMAAEHLRRVNAGPPAGIGDRLLNVGREYNAVVNDVGQRHPALENVTLRVGNGSFKLKVDRYT